MDYSAEVERIRQACQTIFEANIDVQPRALQALMAAQQKFDYFNAKISFSSDFECFKQVVAASPACADLLLKEGVPLANWNINEPKKLDLQKSLDFRDYSKLLAEIFVARFPLTQPLQDAGLRVKSTGILTETDLFLGCLQSGRSNLIPNETSNVLLGSVGLLDDLFVDEQGEDFLNRIETHGALILEADKSHAEQQLILHIDDSGRIRVQAFGANTIGLLDDAVAKNGPFTFRGGVIQHQSDSCLYAPRILEEFEDLINSSSTHEQDFQAFFESQPQILKGIDYRKAHAQPILFKDDGGRLIPDFFLEKIDAGWHTIAELKLPRDSMVIRRRNRVYFAQWVQEAVAQLQFYREWFESPANRSRFEEQQGLKSRVYRPKMVLIAGRSHHFIDDIERIQLLSNQDHGLSLWTYDDVLNRVKRYQSFMRGE